MLTQIEFTSLNQLALVLTNDVALVPCVARVEALYIAKQKQGSDAAAERFALIEALPIVILWSFDADVVRNAARVKAGHRVSLGDALMAGFAMRYGATLLHKDSEFEQLADVLTLEALPYKTKTR